MGQTKDLHDGIDSAISTLGRDVGCQQRVSKLEGLFDGQMGQMVVQIADVSHSMTVVAFLDLLSTKQEPAFHLTIDVLVGEDATQGRLCCPQNRKKEGMQSL